MTTLGGRSTRSDATKNRAHILCIAEGIFAEQGLDVPMDTIAKKAGVGAGTLYRHFPNRDALVATVVDERVGDLRQVHRTLVASEQGVSEKLGQWLEAMRSWMTSYDGLPEPLRRAWEDEETPLGVNCTEVIAMTEEFLQDAQYEGSARPDLSARDLYLANLGAAWAAAAPLADTGTSKVVATLLSSGWQVIPGN
ncbi:TetR/AcrR family transcriptional regulator [Corynebacterium sp. A21]|uniref:TetR/AcrR family transcriptional regulator n=1 Tax=Corynebacterium sp. A21 TaxID=3457318 RepID=UPI003FD1098D